MLKTGWAEVLAQGLRLPLWGSLCPSPAPAFLLILLSPGGWAGGGSAWQGPAAGCVQAGTAMHSLGLLNWNIVLQCYICE